MRSAGSFSASPSANPAGRRKRLSFCGCEPSVRCFAQLDGRWLAATPALAGTTSSAAHRRRRRRRREPRPPPAAAPRHRSTSARAEDRPRRRYTSRRSRPRRRASPTAARSTKRPPPARSFPTRRRHARSGQRRHRRQRRRAPPPRPSPSCSCRARSRATSTVSPPRRCPRRRAVQQIIWAGNQIIGLPYIFGGGHASFISPGYDCSGTVSFALHGASLLQTPRGLLGIRWLGLARRRALGRRSSRTPATPT